MRISISVIVGAVGVAAGALAVGCGGQGADQDLIGTWQRLREDGTLRDQYTFGQDGTFAFDEVEPDDPTAEDHMVGTYDATNRTVVATVTNALDASHARLTFSYYAGASSFSSAARLPAGAHSGIVGEWQGAVKIEVLDETGLTPQGGMATETYRADGTFQVTLTPSDGSPPEAWQGTYTEDSPGLFTASGVTTAGHTRTATLRLLENAALVSPDRIWVRK